MDELTKVALVGTTRFTGVVPGNEQPAAALVADSSPSSRERVLLLRCGVESIYGMAGRRPTEDIDPVTPAPPETRKLPSRRLAAILADAAENNQNDLVIDFLEHMAGHGVVVPPELLPLLLASTHKDVRRRLIPVLGERGTWLLRQNPEWSDLLAGSGNLSETPSYLPIDVLKQTWDEGKIDARCETIKTLRRQDPTLARDWITQAFPREKAGERARLVDCLAIGLSDRDEPFLDGCTSDRSAVVGQSAARLLSCLPRSALAGRMRDRAEAMLALERDLAGVKPAKIVCSPPQQVEPAWERDGVPKQTPTGQGQRAFWAETVLAAVPPSHWQTHFHLQPQALIDAVIDDPFAGSVLTGWTQAACRFAATDVMSPEWLVPLWKYWRSAAKGREGRAREGDLLQMRAVLALMPADLAEASIAPLFEPTREWGEVDALNFLDVPARPWKLSFAKAFLDAARRQVQTTVDESAYRWALSVDQLACAIPPEAFPFALAPWEVASPGETANWFTSSVRTALKKFIAVIEARQRFMTELYA
jgi:hypothetical protein